MHFAFAELEHILSRGLAKSRTLLSCHLVGSNEFDATQLNNLCKILKTQKVRPEYPARLDLGELRSLFTKMKKATNFSQFFTDGLRKQLLKQKMAYKAALKAPLFQVA